MVDANQSMTSAEAIRRAIRMVHGDGALIRNNRIIVKGDAPKRIVSTFGTGPFTLEGNRFYGVSEKDQIAKAFRGTVQMTARDNSFEPVWKTWLERIR